jgi:hypothetical protein
MYITAEYSHKRGKDFILRNHPEELEEIRQAIGRVDAEKLKTKQSKEKTMPGQMLYSPIEMNSEYENVFAQFGWKGERIRMTTTIPEIQETHIGFREIDFVKNKLGVEIQFGKYAFMVYNILAKMTIFSNQGIIDSGVEIVAMRALTDEMSTGVSFFEQVKTDLEYRGEGDIDIPVLVLGVDASIRPTTKTLRLLSEQ